MGFLDISDSKRYSIDHIRGSSRIEKPGMIPKSYIHSLFRSFDTMDGDVMYDIAQAIRSIYGYSSTGLDQGKPLDINDMPVFCGSETATVAAFVETERDAIWLSSTEVSNINEAIESVLRTNLEDVEYHKISIVIIDFKDVRICSVIENKGYGERFLSFSTNQIPESDGTRAESNPDDNVLAELCETMKRCNNQHRSNYVPNSCETRFMHRSKISSISDSLRKIGDMHKTFGAFVCISNVIQQTERLLFEASFNLAFDFSHYAPHEQRFKEISERLYRFCIDLQCQSNSSELRDPAYLSALLNVEQKHLGTGTNITQQDYSEFLSETFSQSEELRSLYNGKYEPDSNWYNELKTFLGSIETRYKYSELSEDKKEIAHSEYLKLVKNVDDFQYKAENRSKFLLWIFGTIISRQLQDITKSILSFKFSLLQEVERTRLKHLIEYKQRELDIRDMCFFIKPNISTPRRTSVQGMKVSHFLGEESNWFLLNTVRVQVDEDVIFISKNEMAKRLISEAKLADPSGAILTDNHLRSDEALEMGRFRKTIYDSREGKIVIQVRSKFRNAPNEIQIEANAGITDGLPSVSTGIQTAFQRSGYSFITGEEANNKVLEDMRIHKEVRQWFLSCAIRGRILLHENSSADGFVPERIPRLPDGGLSLNDHIPLWCFHEFGGEIATIGEHVVFKSHSTADVYYVNQMDEYGVLRIGKKFCLPLENRPKAAYIWRSKRLKIGAADFRTKPPGNLENTFPN